MKTKKNKLTESERQDQAIREALAAEAAEFDRKTASLSDLLFRYWQSIYENEKESFHTLAYDMAIRQRFGTCFVLRDELNYLNYYFRCSLSRPTNWFRYEGTNGMNCLTLTDDK